MDKVSTITTLTARRPKWQYPPAAPTPRILHLPRRPRRKPQIKANAVKPSSQRDKKGKLETLFDQEREFARGVLPIVMVTDQCQEGRRERVAERESVVMEEEKWRFQAEMLRAECNLLRMEREIAVKKMERRRAQVEKALKSAVQTLLSGRKKISDGKEVSMVLEEEIIKLVEKLEKLQRSSRSRNKDLEVRKCSNFDRQASHLQRRLEKFTGEPDEICVKEIQEMAEASLSIQITSRANENFASNCSSNMEILRRRMERLSKGNLLERMEVEYGSMVSTSNSSASSSAATSKQNEFPEISSSSLRQPCKELKPYEERPCSGGCKAIVRRVVEQVRAETEQWSQMQEMLGQVRHEMEELQVSRDFWEDRALDSDYQIQSLQSAVKEWKLKALSSESKASELQAQASMLSAELEGLKKEKAKERSRSKNLAPNSYDSPNEMEKRVLVCRLKENHHHGKDDGCSHTVGRKKVNACSNSSGLDAAKRSPFKDIGNSSSLPLLPLMRQNSRAVFPLHCPVTSSNGRSFERYS
ncbi:centrosome-associated protein CEP250 isoform X2 [Ricinus communis]|uniref:Uncharacterized protein n=1 Tax=Ricinus communis TaxID=3988 RepID=B9RIC3_RICCO|nr:centrosome-associated protein CEP250 isoform X2 [Ricinus communis]EEF48895.1 conserved hypothetical protein [Ricinus communis]|eukprot:XP_002513492.1 centrosome-associated protein CEP250 isoform X2 [Ricinus communis]